MPGFSSLDDMITEMTTNGKTRLVPFSKTTSNAGTSAAARWHEWFTASGIPSTGTFSGTAGVATQLTDSTTGAMSHGGNVSTDLKFLINSVIQTSISTVVPAVAVLVDMLLYYPSCVVTGTPTALNNTATLPRYTTGDGVMAIAAVQTANGAASPALTFTYTDNGGNTGNTASALTAPANSAPVSTLYVNNGSPWAPLATTDTGVRKIDSYTLASGTTGTAAFILVKPLAFVPLTAVNTAYQTDFLYQMPSMPQIVDGACLAWLTMVGAAMTSTGNIQGSLTVAWG